MATFNVPEATPRSVFKIEQFRGVDFTTSPEIVANDKSPNAINMVRDAIGTVRKSMGFYRIEKFNNPVYGYYKLRADENGLYHSGKEILRKGVVLYSNAAERPAVSFELDGKLWIADGKKLLLYIYYKGEYAEATSSYYFLDKTIYDDMSVDAKETITFAAGYSSYTLPRLNYRVVSAEYADGTPVKIIDQVGNKVGFGETTTKNVIVKTEGKGTAYNGYINLGVPTKIRILDYKVSIEVYSLNPAEKYAYIPLFRIGQPPQGGSSIGTYEPLNLLQDKIAERFYGDGTSKTIQLSFSDLSEFIEVRKMNPTTTEWELIEQGADTYTFNADSGKLTFKDVLAKPPITGEDNYEVLYQTKNRQYLHERINKCTIGALYGVNGASDRLFLSGNPDFINYDWYSGLLGTGTTEGKNVSGAYFPDTNYGVLGNESSKVVGYTIINNYLAAHKDELSDERTVIIRSGELVSGPENGTAAAFPIKNTLQGPGAIAPRSFAYLQTEPMFLTASGVYAITASDVTGEKYSQRRSYFLNGKLTREENLDKSFAIMFNDYYMLFVNGSIYMLDGLQTIQSGQYDPYSTRQYAGFYRTGVPALCAWNDNRTLNFGTEDGSVYRFYTDPNSPASYMDFVTETSEGYPVESVWETSEIHGDKFYKNKTFRHLALELKAEPVTSVEAHGYRKGMWKFIKKEEKKTRYFSYPSISYDKFTYNTDDTSKTIPSKIRLRRLDKAKFKFVNNEPTQPFGLIAFAVEFVSGNNYKG